MILFLHPILNLKHFWESTALSHLGWVYLITDLAAEALVAKPLLGILGGVNPDILLRGVDDVGHPRSSR